MKVEWSNKDSLEMPTTTMSDYIKREDAIASIMAHDLVEDGDGSREWAEHLLENATTADVVEVRHGRWLIGVNGVICSECEQLARFSWNYCPVCGAKMDEREQENE